MERAASCAYKEVVNERRVWEGIVYIRGKQAKVNSANEVLECAWEKKKRGGKERQADGVITRLAGPLGQARVSVWWPRRARRRGHA